MTPRRRQLMASLTATLFALPGWVAISTDALAAGPKMMPSREQRQAAQIAASQRTEQHFAETAAAAAGFPLEESEIPLLALQPDAAPAQVRALPSVEHTPAQPLSPGDHPDFHNGPGRAAGGSAVHNYQVAAPQTGCVTIIGEVAKPGTFGCLRHHYGR